MPAFYKQNPLWRTIRGIKRRLQPPCVDEALSKLDCRFTMTLIDAPVAVRAEQDFDVQIEVLNQGGTAWSSVGSKPIRLVQRWQTHDGKPYGNPNVRELPHALYPGETQTGTLLCQAPNDVGDFTLLFDFDQDGPLSERNRLSRPIHYPLRVHGLRRTDIDYYEVFRVADLDQDHWSVVGAYSTKAEYEASIAARKDMMLSLGLKPDSRVLDIGCGTGQGAIVVEDYLNDDGAFYGTDIGKEAIEYCQRRFTKPNFVFAHGEMTRVPFDESSAGLFDMAIFWSVFTHVYVDESMLLLAEAKRLLKPRGRVIADILLSPYVERDGGHRGEMFVNREHFLRLAQALGFQPTQIGEWKWTDATVRQMFTFDNDG